MSIFLQGPDMAAEVLKLLRGQWLTRYRIAAETGASETRVRAWVQGLHEQGLLIDRPAEGPRGRPDTEVREYTVAPAWMGVDR